MSEPWLRKFPAVEPVILHPHRFANVPRPTMCNDERAGNPNLEGLLDARVRRLDYPITTHTSRGGGRPVLMAALVSRRLGEGSIRGLRA